MVVLTLTTCSNTDDTDDEFADQHAESTPDENCAATQTLDDVEGNGSGAHVDESGNERD